MFDLLNNQFLVPTPAHTIVAQLAADLTIDMFGPFQAGDTNTKVVRTCSIIAIPLGYSQLFLASDGITPKYYFFKTAVHPHIINNNSLEGKCTTVLIHFFQVAIICNVSNTPSTLKWLNLLTHEASSVDVGKWSKFSCTNLAGFWSVSSKGKEESMGSNRNSLPLRVALSNCESGERELP
mmetsp:Transcript_29824/g.45729  ORF Transcript_29824/g.45729 Transcript_29824/m.45729 type:complete len:180 (-) Transcript_29824:305-844(-)